MTGSKVQTRVAWRFEADTWPGMKFADYRQQLIHETTKIEAFFRDTHGEQFIIAAPKGFGKTLLLIAKKKQIEERSLHSTRTIDENDAKAIPSASSGGEMVDRPAGIFPFLSTDRINTLKTDYQFWKNLWKISIMAAALKLRTHAADPMGLQYPSSDQKGPQPPKFPGLPSLLASILEDESQHSAAMIFVSLMEADYGDQIEILRRSGVLNRAFLNIRNPIVMFIDNVDEYFKPMLEEYAELGDSTRDSYYRTRSNAVWTIAQVALAGAVYEIHKSNSHVKVYCTIRREAFLRLDEYDDQYGSIIGCTLEIEYETSDFAEIFYKNIRLMSSTTLTDPALVESDPIAAFVGKDNARVKHKFVDQKEDLFAFVLRHTFYRPRDLMILGASIAALSASARSHESIRLAIDRATDDVVKALASEMSPFFGLPDIDRLAKHIHHNVLTLEQLEDVSRAYVAEAGEANGRDNEHAHPFCVLSKIGMLGRIRREFGESTTTRQHFTKPREVTMSNDVGLPATEEYYLIHPALDHRVSHHAGGQYFRNFHRTNIVGNGLAWAEPSSAYFAARGDICGFTEVMTSEFHESVSKKMYEWATASCDHLSFFEVNGGDSILLIDRSPERLVDAAREFVRRAAAHKDRSLTLRFGGAAGPISFPTYTRRIENQWQDIEFPVGLALRTCSRLEPFAPPGTLLVDEEFRRLAEPILDGEIREVRPDELASVRLDPKTMKFSLQKNADDPPYHTRLYLLSLTASKGGG